MGTINQPFSNLQLEILKAFSYNLSKDELIEFKDMLAKFFAERAIQGANQVWEKNNWTDSDVDRLLTTKMRK